MITQPHKLKISIHQPAYLPYLGYIEKLKNSDVHILLDTVQFSKNSFDNRNMILPNKRGQWLTIPIKHNFGQNYLEAEPVDMKWIDDHKKKITQAYKDSPKFKYYMQGLKASYYGVSQIYSPNLADIAFEMLPLWKTIFDIKTPVVRASQLDLDPSLRSSELLLEICKRMNATEYYSGKMGKNYLNEQLFTHAGVQVSYQKYLPPHTYSVVHHIMTEGEEL